MKRQLKPTSLLICQPIRGRIFRLSPTEGRVWLLNLKRWESNPWEELEPSRFAALADGSPLISLTHKEVLSEHRSSEA